MKVILLKDVKGQGKSGQLIEVSDGYARNFLLPKKLAAPATNDNLNTMRQAEKAKLAQVEREKAESMAIAEKLSGCFVKIAVRAGESGKLFGSVTSREISEGLAEQFKINIEKNRIVLPEPIKSFGTFEVKCKLGHEIFGTINVVVAEKK